MKTIRRRVVLLGVMKRIIICLFAAGLLDWRAALRGEM